MDARNRGIGTLGTECVLAEIDDLLDEMGGIERDDDDACRPLSIQEYAAVLGDDPRWIWEPRVLTSTRSGHIYWVGTMRYHGHRLPLGEDRYVPLSIQESDEGNPVCYIGTELSGWRWHTLPGDTEGSGTQGIPSWIAEATELTEVTSALGTLPDE